MLTIKATIYFENPFWVGCFERTDKGGFAVARKIFGPEPTDPEIYQFILENFDELKFGQPQAFDLKIKRVNPKRLQRQVKREMEKLKSEQMPSTVAQDFMREELEKNKKMRKKKSKAEQEQLKEKKFQQKQQKKKEKKRGH